MIRLVIVFPLSGKLWKAIRYLLGRSLCLSTIARLWLQDLEKFPFYQPQNREKSSSLMMIYQLHIPMLLVRVFVCNSFRHSAERESCMLSILTKSQRLFRKRRTNFHQHRAGVGGRRVREDLRVIDDDFFVLDSEVKSRNTRAIRALESIEWTQTRKSRESHREEEKKN